MKISNVANIVNTKINASILTTHTYISTECMLPNCGGIENCSSIPNGKVTSFDKNDILLSNIRPYFKKLWFSTRSGGCSNDVICLRVANRECLPKYLYYALCTDKFIDSFSASSKGTKMPRGDKNALLTYEIPDRNIEDQLHIVDILGTLDEKIEYYDKLINSLEQNGELIFKDFIENKSLLKKHICLSDIATFYNGYSYSGDELCEQSEEALVTIKNFDRNGGFKIEGLKPIKITGKIKPTMFVELGDLLVAHTDLTQNADIIGNPIILLNLGNYKKAAISMDLVKVESSKLSKELLYYILKNSDFKAHALGYCSGTTVLHLNKKALQEYEFDLPLNDSTIEKVNNKLKTIFDRIQIAFLERQKLTELKQLYLQKFFG